MRALIFALTTFTLQTILFGQNTINLNPETQVFYDFENGVQSSIALKDWDIALEPNGDYGIRLNEIKGARVWAKPGEVEDNCFGIIMCRGLQDHTPSNVDTTGMRSQNNGWTELHNSYETWSDGAFNQEKGQLNGDIVTYGWGGYRATNSSPAHAIIGYRIFVVRTQRGDYKQFFIRKSNSAGYDFAYANLDGSDVVERSINRADYEDKMFAYLSMETGVIQNPEPPRTNWDFVITRYPEGKSSEPYKSYVGVLHHPDYQSESKDGSNICHNPSGDVNTAINTIGQNFGVVVNESQVLIPHYFFIENAQNETHAVKVLNIHPKGENISIWAPKYETSALALEGLVMDESCPECNDGEISLSISGGTCPYNISWQHGPNTGEISNLPPGTYQVTVEDQGGNSITKSFSIAPFPCTLSFGDIKMEEPLCFGNRNGRISVEVNGAQGALSYLWNGVSGNAELDQIVAGSYQLKLSDGAGCSLDTTFILSQPELLSVNPSSQDESCNKCKNGGVALNISGGSPNYNISWNDGDTSATRSMLTPGVYSYDISDQNECSLDGSLVIEEFICPDITLSANVKEPKCWNSEDGQLSVNLAGSDNKPFNYKWNGLDGTEVLSNLAAGSYLLEFTDNKGCSIDSNFTLVSPDEIIVTSKIIDESCFECNDGSANLSEVSGGYPPYSYLWPDGSTAAQRNDLSPGNYEVVVMDSNDCEKRVLIKILKFGCKLEILNLDAREPSCFGGSDGELSVDFTGNSGNTKILWSTGDTLIYSSNLTAGNYWVLISDGGACQDSASIVLQEPDSLSLDFTFKDESCPGCSDWRLRADVSGGTAPYTFIWNGLEDEQEIPVDQGSYELSIIDQQGCSITRDTVIELSTGIQEFQNISISIAPKPFQDRLQIRTSKQVEIAISNVQGSIIFKERLDMGSHWISTSAFAPGVYVAKFYDSGTLVGYDKLLKR